MAQGLSVGRSLARWHAGVDLTNAIDRALVVAQRDGTQGADVPREQPARLLLCANLRFRSSSTRVPGAPEGQIQ